MGRTGSGHRGEWPELIRRQGERERGRQGDGGTGRPAVGGFDGVGDPRQARVDQETRRQGDGGDKEAFARAGVAGVESWGRDSGLATDIASALVREPRSGGLHNALGLILATAGRGADEVANYFARAVERDPEHILARLNWGRSAGGSPEKRTKRRRRRSVL